MLSAIICVMCGSNYPSGFYCFLLSCVEEIIPLPLNVIRHPIHIAGHDIYSCAIMVFFGTLWCMYVSVWRLLCNLFTVCLYLMFG